MAALPGQAPQHRLSAAAVPAAGGSCGDGSGRAPSSPPRRLRAYRRSLWMSHRGKGRQKVVPAAKRAKQTGQAIAAARRAQLHHRHVPTDDGWSPQATSRPANSAACDGKRGEAAGGALAGLPGAAVNCLLGDGRDADVIRGNAGPTSPMPPRLPPLHLVSSAEPLHRCSMHCI